MAWPFDVELGDTAIQLPLAGPPDELGGTHFESLVCESGHPAADRLISKQFGPDWQGLDGLREVSPIWDLSGQEPLSVGAYGADYNWNCRLALRWFPVPCNVSHDRRRHLWYRISALVRRGTDPWFLAPRATAWLFSREHFFERCSLCAYRDIQRLED
jgi:hypothetical protein